MDENVRADITLPTLQRMDELVRQCNYYAQLCLTYRQIINLTNYSLWWSSLRTLNVEIIAYKTEDQEKDKQEEEAYNKVDEEVGLIMNKFRGMDRMRKSRQSINPMEIIDKLSQWDLRIKKEMFRRNLSKV